jgi:hypothetical protein
MNIFAELPVHASKEAIWKVITDIEHAPSTIKGIEKVEVLHRPEKGFVGFKWRETRTMFGKKATEEMWITEAKENEYYIAKAGSHGCDYTSRVAITPKEGKNYLSMTLEAKTNAFMGKLMMFFMGWMFVGMAKKAFLKDLQDIKAKVEFNH